MDNVNETFLAPPHSGCRMVGRGGLLFQLTWPGGLWLTLVLDRAGHQWAFFIFYGFPMIFLGLFDDIFLKNQHHFAEKTALGCYGLYSIFLLERRGPQWGSRIAGHHFAPVGIGSRRGCLHSLHQLSCSDRRAGSVTSAVAVFGGGK